MTLPRPWRALAPLLILWIPACSKPVEPMPDTQPVTGTVTYKKGGPVAGQITFQPMTDQQLLCNGPIDAEGKFIVSTMRTSDQKRVEGVPEGEYKVTVFPQSTEQFIFPREIPGKVSVKAGANHFDFKIDRGR